MNSGASDLTTEKAFRVGQAIDTNHEASIHEDVATPAQSHPAAWTKELRSVLSDGTSAGFAGITEEATSPDEGTVRTNAEPTPRASNLKASGTTVRDNAL